MNDQTRTRLIILITINRLVTQPTQTNKSDHLKSLLDTQNIFSQKMVISGTRNPIIHKWYKRNERIELYKGKDTVLSTVYILHTTTFFHKITKGLSTHIKLIGYLTDPSRHQLKHIDASHEESISQC
jgi:hypothetical protein